MTTQHRVYCMLGGVVKEIPKDCDCSQCRSFSYFQIEKKEKKGAGDRE